MKSLFSITLAAGLIALASLSACGSKEKTDAAAPVENRMSLSAQDTTTTLGLVNDFMSRLVERDTKSAASMLYTVDLDDFDKEPYPLSDEQIANLDAMLSMPVTDYEIVEYVFNTADSNEVRCKVTVDGKFTTNWYFKPVRYLGNWYLCIKDSAQGDRSLNSEQAEIAR